MAAALRNTRSSDEKKTRASPAKKAGTYENEELKDDNNGDEEDDEEEAETRCICGELDPPDANGLFIQCEKCQVWQHGFCVSINEIVPEKYWCELCKPELHSIIIRPSGKITKYLPVQPKDSKETTAANQRRKSRKTNSCQSTKYNPEDDYDLNSRRKKERSTYNSREDARYEALIQRVMEESKREAKLDNTDDEKSNIRSSRTRRRRYEEGNEEENREEDEQQEETQNDDIENKDNEEKESKEFKQETINEILKEDPEESASSSSTTTNNNSNYTRSQKTKESELNDSTASRKKRPKNKRSRKPAVSRKQVSSQKEKDSSIDFSKPTKPRLPQQRTTMNEMRKRVAAILEFIGRTQIDLATEQKDESEFTKYVEDSNSKETIEKLFQNYNVSLELMDALTRKLLLWEQKFGKLGEK